MFYLGRSVWRFNNISPYCFRETCNNGSILDLKEDIQSHNIPFECVDDPP